MSTVPAAPADPISRFDRAIARREVLEAFAIGRKHGRIPRDARDAFHYLAGWLHLTDEEVNEILGRKRTHED
jgi:hypothetical protein